MMLRRSFGLSWRGEKGARRLIPIVVEFGHSSTVVLLPSTCHNHRVQTRLGQVTCGACYKDQPAHLALELSECLTPSDRSKICDSLLAAIDEYVTDSVLEGAMVAGELTDRLASWIDAVRDAATVKPNPHISPDFRKVGV